MKKILIILCALLSWPCLAADSKACKKAREAERTAKAISDAAEADCDSRSEDNECNSRERMEEITRFAALMKATLERKRLCNE